MPEINQAGSDYLFITEIMNDLFQHGFAEGGKAYTMLRDWKHELRMGANFPKTNQRKVHAEVCGSENW